MFADSCCVGNVQLLITFEVEASGVGSHGKSEKPIWTKMPPIEGTKPSRSPYDSLTTLREVFHYHFINAHGSVIEVQQRIISELKYQSSLRVG